MEVPPEITFRNIQPSDELKEQIDHKIAKLEQFCDYIISCHVAVEQPHRHHHKGNPFRVRIAVCIPHNHELVVDESPQGERHYTLNFLVQKAFDSMGRQVKALVQKQREAKRHPEGAPPLPEEVVE